MDRARDNAVPGVLLAACQWDLGSQSGLQISQLDYLRLLNLTTGPASNTTHPAPGIYRKGSGGGGGTIPTPNPWWLLQRADFRLPSSFPFFFCLREFGATPSTSQILGNFSKMLIFFSFFSFFFYLWEFGTIPSMLLTSAPSSRSRWPLHSLTPTSPK